MITFEYISILIPASLNEHLAILKEYGDIGWCLVTMYNGYVFFERRTKVKVG